MKILQQLSFFNLKFVYLQILRKINLLIEILIILIAHFLLFIAKNPLKQKNQNYFIHAWQRAFRFKVC
jgi:hypothetical protein